MDSSSPIFTSVGARIERDRYGRPLIIPPGGGKPTSYTRVTTFVGAMEDTFNLTQWQMRQVIKGLLVDPSLAQRAKIHEDDNQALNGIAKQAMEAAKSHARAELGTDLHKLSERIDRGESLAGAGLPANWMADLAAYERTTAHLQPVAMETFVVHDGFKFAGTFDRLIHWDGQLYVGDLKTGKDLKWGGGKIAQQIAAYSRSNWYDPATGGRTSLAEKFGAFGHLNTERGIVIHLPAGEARCSLFWVDLDAGWSAVEMSAKVREYQKHKAWFEEIPVEVSNVLVDPIDNAVLALNKGGIATLPIEETGDRITDALNAATTVAELYMAFSDYEDDWKPEHTKLASARKAQLAQTA